MDTSTAIRLTASAFSAKTPMSTDACDWVTGEIAVAMGISETNMAPIATSNPRSEDSHSPVVEDAPSPVVDHARSSWPQDARSPVVEAPAPVPGAGYPPGGPGHPPGGAGYSPGTAAYPPGGTAFLPGQVPQGFGVAPAMGGYQIAPGAGPGYPP